MSGLRLNDKVKTPNGTGLVQGRMIDKRTLIPEIKVLVAHVPGKDQLNETYLKKHPGSRFWILDAYLPETVERI